MIFKIFLAISLLAAVIYSDSFDSNESDSFDCDSFFVESEDSLLERFITRENLKSYYEKRNDNHEACLKFLGKFTNLIEEYRNEEGKQEEFRLSKRISKLKTKF
jgi:hypothetical protein